jgi:hypothetical protein
MSVRTTLRDTLIAAATSGPRRPASIVDAAAALLRSPDAGAPRDERLRAVADWLALAQEIPGDGGVSWGYTFRRGWVASYPETTGYLVPTFLAVAEHLRDPAWRERAARAISFLLPLQLAAGGFPGRTVAQNRTAPSVFNTAQIMHGLLRWSDASTDDRARRAAHKAARWLVSVQDPDGAWRSHVHNGVATTYTAHASCWLADAGRLTDDPDLVAAAARHLDWVLAQQDPRSGWFDLAGFSASDHASRVSVTHTIAYVIWGVLHLGVELDRPDAVAAARQAATAIAALLARMGTIPGVLDHAWRPRASWTCATGDAQMSLVFLRLANMDGDDRFHRAAQAAIELAGKAQRTTAGPVAVRGGIPGSVPMTGAYLPFCYPNWAAKFYLDGLLALDGGLHGVAHPGAS